MKTIVHQYVTSDDNDMFEQCAAAVMKGLDDIIPKLRLLVADQQSAVLDSIRETYPHLIKGTKVFNGVEQSSEGLRTLLSKAGGEYQTR
jgi:chloramphenicol O-acetyltransferase